MGRPTLLLPALIALLLAGCEPSASPAPGTPLPAPPADAVACLQRAGADIPDRALTAGEAERLWKTDRRTQAAVRRCGARLLAWYESLRSAWR